MEKVKISPELAKFIKCLTGTAPKPDSMCYEHTISIDNLKVKP